MTALALFEPAIREWFAGNFESATDIQQSSWPLIAAGHHVLISAPTGSGKTLTAFLWALNRFASKAWEPGRTRVLYISPLKALNNDIRCNLLRPLAELRQQSAFPAVGVQTRSGDTPQSERQRMLRKPPDILITTPESLALLLTTVRGRQALSSVETVILDEIHSVVANRRGVQLMTSLERLVELAGEFQRIALSATVRPLDAVARYLGGRDADAREREVAVVESAASKVIEFRVCFPQEARDAALNGKKIWDPLSDSFRDLIEANRSTLLFTNSRRLAEKITLKINQDLVAPLAYAHHGSLAREIRTEVERRMKQGELKAIVATSSLELGIDVGHLDEVVMVQSPPSVAAAMQRIGRAGHRVGEISRGTLFPSHAQDFLEAAVLAEAIRYRDIEPLKPMENALDVLAQIIVSMCATDPWPVDQLFGLITRAAPYHGLAREHFDLVVDMLAGRYAGSRVRELKPRISFDRIEQTVQANRGAVLALYNAGGTIPDRGYYQLRHSDTGAQLGELDEEFVWEAHTGQTFTLGTQAWQIQRVTHNDVMVRAASAGSSTPPFWRSESYNRSFHYSLAITRFLEHADGELSEGRSADLQAELQQQRGFEATAAQELLDYLARQRESTGNSLPHRHHVLIEQVNAGPGGYRGPDCPSQLVLHTFWGAQLNRPWALALEAAWRQRYQAEPEIHADNNCVVIQARDEVDPETLLSLVTPASLEGQLRVTLEQSGFFGARFRECAGRSLLLTRQRFNQRLPLWMSRLQAKKLMTATSAYSDFPVLLETWRSCLQDEFDLEGLVAMLSEIEAGQIAWSFASTAFPSPFAANVSFAQISRYMYADDTPETDAQSALSGDLIASAVRLDALRPRLERAIVAQFIAKRQRSAPGYEPVGEREWQEWLKERVLLPEAEWSEPLAELLVDASPLSVLESGGRRWLTHVELIHGLYSSGLFPGKAPQAPLVPERRTAEQLALEILSFYGPLTERDIQALLPTVPDGLLKDERLVSGELLEDSASTRWCDADNLEALLRFQRASRRSQLEARPAMALPGLWAALQHLGSDSPEQPAALARRLEQLRGYSAPVRIWLMDILPARGLAADHLLDDTLQDMGLIWLGTGTECMTLCYPDEAAMFQQGDASCGFSELFVDPGARYSFFQLADRSNLSLQDFSDAWWTAVWAGGLTADSLVPLRRGLERGFKLAVADNTAARRRRARGLAMGWPGNWSLVHVPAESDALSELDARKDRVRLLLDRYGVLSREIVNREWSWREAFRALRLMELAGEVACGYFFEELSGPQFASRTGLALLREEFRVPRHVWLSALDPASPCALGLDWPGLPQRRVNNYLAFYQGALALVVEQSGRRLQYYLPPDHPALDQVNALLLHITRLRRRVVVASVNETPVQQSPFRAALERRLSLNRDHKQSWLELP